MNDLRELYQELIIDHGYSPRNFGRLENANYSKEGYNPLCGDKLKLYMLISGGIIKDVKFEGAGCAISMASASLMTECLIGKTLQEFQTIFSGFHELITGDKDRVDTEKLGKLMVLGGVAQYPSRVKCATLAWHTAKACIENDVEKVSTEKIISLTTAAEAHIIKMLAQKPNAIGFRLSVKQTGCTGYMYMPEIVGESAPDDLQVKQNDFTIYIDKSAVNMIQGTEIDYVKKGLGVSQLVFNNPNAKSLCGCGESFNLRESADE